MKQREETLFSLLRRLLLYLVIPVIMAGSISQGATATGSQLYEILVDGKYGFIDQTGSVVVQPSFTAVRPFRHGMAGVQLTDSGEWAYINAAGQIATP